MFIRLATGLPPGMSSKPALSSLSLSCYNFLICHTPTNEHSLLGEISLYGWSPVFYKFEFSSFTLYNKQHSFFFVKSNLFKLETSHSMLRPPTVSVLCSHTFADPSPTCSLSLSLSLSLSHTPTHTHTHKHTPAHPHTLSASPQTMSANPQQPCILIPFALVIRMLTKRIKTRLLIQFPIIPLLNTNSRIHFYIDGDLSTHLHPSMTSNHFWQCRSCTLDL